MPMFLSETAFLTFNYGLSTRLGKRQENSYHQDQDEKLTKPNISTKTKLVLVFGLGPGLGPGFSFCQGIGIKYEL